MLTTEKHRANHLQKPDVANSIEAERTLSPDDVWRMVAALGKLQPPQSHRPIVGPLLTWVRQCLWRLIGFELMHQQIAAIVRETLDSPVAFREGSHDRAIWIDVVNNNEYGLPESFAADDIVLDIGMHIGSFSYAALSRGCANLYGFEPDPENFSLAAHNLKRFGSRAHLSQKAVWRSDRSGDRLFFGGYDQDNTGGGSVLYNTSGEQLDVIAFDDVIQEVTNRGQRRVRLLKIDCEGSEFPILLTSRLLHRIDTIAGEFHEVGGLFDSHAIPERARVPGVSRFTIEVLATALTRAG